MQKPWGKSLTSRTRSSRTNVNKRTNVLTAVVTRFLDVRGSREMFAGKVDRGGVMSWGGVYKSDRYDYGSV